MNITIRLYWIHDYDLIGLADSPDISLSKCAKQALIAYAQGDRDYSIHVPDDSRVKEKKTNRMIHFRIDPNNPDEEAAYKVYRGFGRGVRNSAIKNMIRMYMDKANFQPYISNPTQLAVSLQDNDNTSSGISVKGSALKTVDCLSEVVVTDKGNKPEKANKSNDCTSGKKKDKSFKESITNKEPNNSSAEAENNSDMNETTDIFDWFDQNLGGDD